MAMDRRRFLEALGASTLVLSGSFVPLSACNTEGDTGEEGAPLLFAVLTDLHFQARLDHVNNLTVQRSLEQVSALGVDLVVLTGDLVDELPSDEPAYYEEHDDTALHRLEEALATVDVPVLMALGNHDYYMAEAGLDNHLTEDKPAREALLQARLGVPGPWYRQDHGGVAFYMLNSMQDDDRVDWSPGMCGSFGQEQLDWLEAQLADGVPAVLCFHHPLALDQAVAAGVSSYTCMEVPRDEGEYDKYEGEVYDGWTDPIYALIEAHADQIIATFVGHSHWWVHDEWAGVPVLMGDSTGNSVLMTEVDGEPMRYHLVAVWPEEGRLEVRNLEQIPLA